MPVKRALWSNLALSLAAPLVFFLICEGLLLLIGIQPLALTEDPYVGYAGSRPLFIEDRGTDGQAIMVTNPVKLTHFNSQNFPKAKPPNTYRIFSVGGSTTYGHPWRDPVSFTGWLRALLPYADSTRQWEVINAGGISYASYREANLIAELIKYQPDLFLVYSGHNEFLEERTYRKTAGIPETIRKLSSAMDHTRTYSVMRLLARKLQNGKTSKPDSSSKDSSSIKKSVLAGEVDDILAKTIGPTSYTRNDSLKKDVLEHYRLSLARMAELAHSVGAEIIFITTPGNEKDCSPFKSEATPGITEESKSKVMAWMKSASEKQNAPLEALQFYDSALSLDGRNASIAYLAGQAAYAGKLYPEAKRYFQQALNEDICPLRAQTSMHDIVLETAKTHHAQALDFTEILEEKTFRESGSRVLGEPDFVDHVHLSIDDYRLIALSLLEKFRAMGVLGKTNLLTDSTIKAVTSGIMAKMGSRELGEGLHNLAKVINWAGKHEDAARIAERALAVDSLGLEAIWSSLFVGSAMERQGKEDLAIPHYRRAVHLDTNNTLSRQYLAAALMRQGLDQEAADEYTKILSLDPNDVQSANQLGILKIRLGQANDAIAPLEAALKSSPNQPESIYLVGEALLQNGKLAEAEAKFLEALKLNPKEAHAMMGLGKIAQAQGHIPEAINHYAKALSINPQLPEARLALSKLLGSFGAKP